MAADRTNAIEATLASRRGRQNLLLRNVSQRFHQAAIKSIIIVVVRVRVVIAY